MKVKLLKELRKKFIIQKRNNKYRVIDTTVNYINYPKWTTLKKVLEHRRELILNASKEFECPKVYNYKPQ